MILIITDKKVYKARTLKELKKKHGLNIEEQELSYIGSDQVAILTDKDIDFVRDKAKLERVAMDKLYKKKDTSSLYFALIILMFIILTFQGCMTGGVA